ncbi:uncharacterized protein LODBEIA_P22370 [Lodderomyces beijingensis]|uniref:glucan endo-1,3-beta-D-glucosidase n=1 Tax=Lodderomyces beijingensis TaxID=1775926 RepID=A0ABP0ZK58_9ASCO
MKFTTASLLAVLSSLVSVEANGCIIDGGNYYCSETNKVLYKGIGFSGSYQDVISMDETSGVCKSQPFAFSGNLAPLNEEVSVHFRGPIKLLQFGVYYPKSNSKRQLDEQDCNVKHIHHKHKRATEVVAVTETVFVDSNGNLVTSQATSTVSTSETPVSDKASPVADPVSQEAGTTSISALGGEGKAYRPLSTKSAPTTTSSVPESSETPTADGAWTRSAYYTPGSADSCVFLNYYGGSGSGTWSAAFGNSLSYANADNSGGSSQPVALSSVTLPSNKEFVIMSSQQCSSDGSCGYVRPNSVAHHGFGGSSKIFVFEFEMPHDSASGFNGDMPAVWLLNAKIPRTLQYGDASCSCWSTGCGELDLFEILSGGSTKLISHLHSGQGAAFESNSGGAGSQDYFARPTSGSMKAAVIFISDEVHILKVDDSVSFDASLTEEVVNGWIQQSGSAATIGY